MKESKGKIKEVTFGNTLGSKKIIFGISEGHPVYDGHRIHTSELQKITFDCEDEVALVETCNSIYLVEGLDCYNMLMHYLDEPEFFEDFGITVVIY